MSWKLEKGKRVINLAPVRKEEGSKHDLIEGCIVKSEGNAMQKRVKSPINDPRRKYRIKVFRNYPV